LWHWMSSGFSSVRMRVMETACCARIAARLNKADDAVGHDEESELHVWENTFCAVFEELCIRPLTDFLEYWHKLLTCKCDYNFVLIKYLNFWTLTRKQNDSFLFKV
jgi:hypothetical protein